MRRLLWVGGSGPAVRLPAYHPPVPIARYKLVWFVPTEAAEATRDAVFAAGAGEIGGYRRCSFYCAGTGTFLGTEGTSPAVGSVGVEERVSELRIETVVSAPRIRAVVDALCEAHPYEEVAYDLYPLAELPAA